VKYNLVSALSGIDWKLWPSFKPSKKKDVILEEYYQHLEQAGFKVEVKEHIDGKSLFVCLESLAELQKLAEIVNNPVIVTPEGSIIVYDFYIEE